MKGRGGEKKRNCGFNERLLRQDQFSQAFQIRIDEGKDALPSMTGALCSILLLIILLAYAGYKISILEGKKSIDIIQAVIENHFDEKHSFGGEQGLNIAVAVYD